MMKGKYNILSVKIVIVSMRNINYKNINEL